MAELTDILSTPGPVASVAINAPSAVDDAGEQMSVRWRNACSELESQGLPEGDLERLEAAVGELDHDDGDSFVVLQARGAPPFIESLDHPLVRDLVVVDELPRLGPLLESRQQAVPHLVVIADRTGADIVAFDTSSGDEVIEVDGEELHVSRSAPGGWSQRRFQQRAENTWESNAHEVADVVVETARRIGARLVAVAGDVRAVGLLVDHLPDDVATIVQTLEAQSEDLISEETVRLVADVVARDIRADLERLKEAVGQGRGAADAATTLQALTNGQVETLLVHDDPGDDRRARFDRNGLWCSTDLATPLAETPAEDPAEGRLIDVAIRSALMSDARIRFVPQHGGPAERVGALLRW